MAEVFRVFAAAIVIREGRVLLLRRGPDQRFLPGVWGLPCGKVEFGEDVALAALRELEEEAGLRGTVAKLAGHSAFQSTYQDQECHNVQLTFLVGADTGTVTLSAEHDAHKWHPVDDLGSAGMDDYNRRVVEQALTP